MSVHLVPLRKESRFKFVDVRILGSVVVPYATQGNNTGRRHFHGLLVLILDDPVDAAIMSIFVNSHCQCRDYHQQRLLIQATSRSGAALSITQFMIGATLIVRWLEKCIVANH